jgi:hypothetical protein
VLYTTGRQVTDGLKQLMVEGSGFLPKPYSTEELAGAVEALLPPD